ncbi:hypothetical protein [Pseudomonas sp. CNPSo 3701]|uniref:hypothetical protein n=1 Tax=Pseudomonas sp. CNPSo 3701 TaxID=3027943 RepID=UPI00236423B7|nr:hypothetical protein [Pseudomonas sp. CNPSo 3701]MDD1509999.1 hypothetical protein [Pseudomonas sp. CNPSo 3701]
MTHPEYMFSEMDMQASQALVDHFHSLDDGAKQCFLREFQQPLDQSLATFMLSVVTGDRNDDVRIEAAKILGLYRGDYDDAFIRNALIQLINAGDSEDDSLIVNCIHSLALLELGSVAISRTAAPEPVLPRSKARAAKFSWLNESARNAASRQNGPGPSGCAGNLAMRRWRTWQGNNHSLRPPPSLARFLAATRLALKRQQTLGADEIDFALSIIEQERYVLFQSAAFSLLEQNRRLPAARAAIERLVDNRSYGKAARRALDRVQLEHKS